MEIRVDAAKNTQQKFGSCLPLCNTHNVCRLSVTRHPSGQTQRYLRLCTRDEDNAETDGQDRGSERGKAHLSVP
eukprot:1711632-Prymnesium_polylepis.1